MNTGAAQIPDGAIFKGMANHHLGVYAAEAAAGSPTLTARALQHFRQAFESDPLGIYMAAHNLQLMNELAEQRADGSIVDMTIGDSVEFDVKHPVNTTPS